MMADKKEKKEQPLSVDDQFLKDFLAKGGKVETESGSAVDESNVDALLEEVANNPKPTALHKKAVAKGLGDTAKEEAEKAQKEQERNDRLRAQELKKQRSKAANVASKVSGTIQDNVTDPVIEKAGRTVDRIAAIRTVGGIGLLLAVLVFLLFVVVQVNSAGDTRIKQFWYMLNGRAKLVGRVLVGTGTNSSSGVPGAVNSNGTVNGPDGKPITLKSIGAADTKAIQNPQGPAVQWVQGIAAGFESEYRTLFG